MVFLWLLNQIPLANILGNLAERPFSSNTFCYISPGSSGNVCCDILLLPGSQRNGIHKVQLVQISMYYLAFLYRSLKNVQKRVKFVVSLKSSHCSYCYFGVYASSSSQITVWHKNSICEEKVFGTA